MYLPLLRSLFLHVASSHHLMPFHFILDDSFEHLLQVRSSNHGVFQFCLLGICSFLVFPGGASGKESACQCRRQKKQLWSLGQEDPLEEAMTTHSSILASVIPWTEKSGGLQSMESQRVKTQLKQLSTHAHVHFSLTFEGQFCWIYDSWLTGFLILAFEYIGPCLLAHRTFYIYLAVPCLSCSMWDP